MIRVNEKRRAVRTRHDSVLELYDEEGRLIVGSARLVDMSPLGIRCAGSVALAQGERVRARLRLLRLGVLDVAGRVVRIQKETNVTYYGIEFDSVKPIG